MNRKITVHPTLPHLELTTANLDSMINWWYRTVLGITTNYRSAAPADGDFRWLESRG